MKKILAHPFVHIHVKQGMTFVIAGLIGATIEFTVLISGVELFGVIPEHAKIPAQLCAVTFVFFFNKSVTFRSHGRMGAQSVRFVLVYGFAIVLNYLLYRAILTTGLDYRLANALTIGVIAILNYTMSHGFIFRKKMEVQMPL